MRIAVIGAGPAGLYLAYLIKRRQQDADISVFEQNAARRDVRIRRGVLRPGA